jgi:serine/threonine-protein kinase 40
LYVNSKIQSHWLFQELFNKIKTAEFTIPEDGRVSEDTRNVIRRLLVTDPARRLTATQVRMR